MVPSGSSPEFQLSPDMLTDDGMFIPGSTYQELHTTLRHHVFNIARSQEPSRQPSPSRELDGVRVVDGAQLGPVQAAQIHSSQDDLIEAEALLDADQEYLLWKNWVTEIADWLDKFDRDRHFGRKLPIMAKTCPHLRFSMLALSARQLERKDKSIPASVTLSLYSAAVRLLLPQLHHRDASVLASCVVICVFRDDELFSQSLASPFGWLRLLDPLNEHLWRQFGCGTGIVLVLCENGRMRWSYLERANAYTCQRMDFSAVFRSRCSILLVSAYCGLERQLCLLSHCLHRRSSLRTHHSVVAYVTSVPGT